jgi:hypothetical protein
MSVYRANWGRGGLDGFVAPAEPQQGAWPARPWGNWAAPRVEPVRGTYTRSAKLVDVTPRWAAYLRSFRIQRPAWNYRRSW